MTSPKLARLVLYGDAKSEDEGRAYSYPLEKNSDDRYYQYPSVTTVLKLVDKSALIQWSVNLAVTWCVENIDKLMGMSVEKGINVAKYRHNDVKSERAAIGDGIHATIEAEHEGKWDFPKLDAEQQQIMAHWRQFCVEHKVEAVHSELTMFNRGLGYAGTADGIWYIDGVLCLVDIKTSKSTWPEHLMQLAALWGCDEWVPEVAPEKWESMAPLKVEKVAIVHLRSDLHELIWVDNLEENFEAFQGYLNVWKAKAKLKALDKANAGF